MYFSHYMDRFPDEIFAALNDRKIELEKQGKKLYNMSVGTPDFKTPEHIRKALSEAALDPENWKYSLRDSDELLDAVVEYYQTRYGVTIERDMIASCDGSQEGMSHFGFVMCDPGDVMLLPTPCYPAFITCAKMCGAEPYYYPLNEETHYLPDVNGIPEDVAKKAKMMIVSLPSNPTGSVGTEENYESIVAFAKKYDILIVHDNAYSDIIFDGVHGGSFLKVPGALDVGVEFFSLSKSFDVTGARISFLVGRKDVVGMFRKLRSQYDFGMFLPVQKAAIAALKGPRKPVEEQCDHYQERRDALCQGLRDIGWDVKDSHGSMFVWVKIPDWYDSSSHFVLDLMDQTGVICTPGSSFGPSGERYVRFALVLPPEEIRNAIHAIDESGILKKPANV